MRQSSVFHAVLYTGHPPKMCTTLTAYSSILNRKHVLTNNDFVIIQSMCVPFWNIPYTILFINGYIGYNFVKSLQ